MKKKKKKENTKLLMVVFIMLLILVITLVILCIIKNNEADKNKYANMVIPVYELNTDYEFNINAKTLSEVNEYVFKIVNYKKNEINKEEIPYTIEIKNNTNSIIKVTKDNSNKDLMKNQKSTIIKEKSLKKDEKIDVYYHIKITKNKGLNRKDLIYVKITN